MRVPLVGIATAFTVATFGAASLAAQRDTARTTSISGDLGFVSVSGNTSVTTFNLGEKFTANTRDKRLIFTQIAAAIYGKTNGAKSAESYRFGLRGDRTIGQQIYFFGLTGWDRNTFGGIDHRFEETAGLGFKPVASPVNQLSFEAGVSFFQQTNTFAPAGTSLETDFTAGRIAGAFKHVFTKTSFFTQSVEFVPNFDVSQAWRLNSESAFVAPVSTNIAFKASYAVRYDNQPPFVSATSTTRLRKSDRFLTMGITLSY